MDGALIVSNLLRDKLSINASVINCTHLGKPSADANRPQWLCERV